MIHAPTPVKLLRDLHSKHTLVIGQEYRKDIAAEYPLYLSYVQHKLFVNALCCIVALSLQMHIHMQLDQLYETF